MGLIFVFILVSTICTAIREGIEAKLKTRAAYLERGIRQLLHDTDGTGLAKAFYNHPLIFGLFNGEYKKGESGDSDKGPDLMASGKNLPSYIPSKSFAVALLDIAARGVTGDDATDVAAAEATTGSPVITLDGIRKNVTNMPNSPVQQILLYAIDNAQGDINKVQASIEDWYNSGMDRVSGWYKRSTQWIILWIALIVTIALNVNTIKVVKYLAKNDTQRKMLVASAESAAKDTNKTVGYKDAQATLDTLKLPLGWDNEALTSARMDPKEPDSFWNTFAGPLLGWLITAFAATLGAPFWFDMLNKVMIIRSTVKPNEKSGNEASRDPQTPPAPVININNGPSQAEGDSKGGSTAAAVPALTETVKAAADAGITAVQKKTAEVKTLNKLPEVATTSTTGGTGAAPGGEDGNAAGDFTPPPRDNPPVTDTDNSEADGCDVDATDLTGDEDLPESKGGIQ
ncbi:hypothetical protein [Mucilaginibacter xinganensis]|nr:hypothetical protein [Mucilaginibacter xinganensis]